MEDEPYITVSHATRWGCLAALVIFVLSTAFVLWVMHRISEIFW